MDPPDLRIPFDVAPFVADPVRTARLVLRPLEASDADDVWEYQRLPEVLRYIPWPERTHEEARAHTEKRASARVLEADGDGVFFAMVLDGHVVGDVMLRVDNVEHAQLEIGWVLHPAFQGRGFALEAARAVMEIAFDTLRAHRVHALLDARNLASAKLCERLGMRREGTLLEEEYHDDEWEDTAVYGILDREWAARD